MQLGPIRRMAELGGAGLEALLEFLPVGDAGLGEAGGEEVNRADAFGRGVFEHVQHVGGGDRADHVVDGTGDVGQPCVGGQALDFVGPGG